MRVISQSPDPLARMHTMTKRQGKSGTIEVKALLREDEEFLRALVRTALQEVLEREMTEALGADKGERTAGRQAGLPVGLLRPDADHADRQTRAAGATGPRRAVLDRAVRTVSALGAGARGGTPRAYLERCLAVIADREPVVKAWFVLNPSGAREAADASTERYRRGRPISSIDGMPIGIKDLIETKDLPTGHGCGAFAGNHTRRDSAIVRALPHARAGILGKTVPTEMGGAFPGPTTNPFDPGRTPGGSSSGSAAVIGACMVPAAIGTQVGGSLIRPASYCGNCALKPTMGALHRGERQGYSQSHVGVHAGSLTDMWRVANGNRSARRRRSWPAGPVRHAGLIPSAAAGPDNRYGNRGMGRARRQDAGGLQSHSR